MAFAWRFIFTYMKLFLQVDHTWKYIKKSKFNLHLHLDEAQNQNTYQCLIQFGWSRFLQVFSLRLEKDVFLSGRFISHRPLWTVWMGSMRQSRDMARTEVSSYGNTTWTHILSAQRHGRKPNHRRRGVQAMMKWPRGAQSYRLEISWAWIL